MPNTAGIQQMKTDSDGHTRGTIFDIKEFALHDGSGIRTTVFFKGCPLRCVWCHNPEGQSFLPELMQASGCKGCNLCRKGCSHADCAPFGRCLHACPQGLLTAAGTEIGADELAEKLIAGADLLKMSGGGITLSGGEPLSQIDFACELCGLLRKSQLNIAVETCGYSSGEAFSRILKCSDFIYFDLKLADEEQHIRYTGVSNKPILDNLRLLRESGIPYVLRTPLIPGITDTEENLSALKKIAGNDKWQLLPYNTLAGAKYAMLGREYRLP